MKKITISLTLGLSVLLTACLAAPSYAAAQNQKTVTTTQASSKTLSCSKAKKTCTQTVSSQKKNIKGTDSLNGGTITGEYTGTQKTVVTDHFTKNKTKKTRKTTVTTTKHYTMRLADKTLRQLLNSVDSRLANAFRELKFTFNINAASGRLHIFSSSGRSITLGSSFQFNELYFMMGHFLSFISGNTGTSSAFRAIFQAEQSRFPGSNKMIFQNNPLQYFAACTEQYFTNPSALQRSCPSSYAAITQALNRITAAQIQAYKRILHVA